MITPVDRALLTRNKLLRDISLESIESILQDSQVVTLNSGAKLLEIGQQNHALYLVLDGELHVYLDSRDLAEHAVLGTGECVGELSLIDGGHTSALVVASGDTRLLAIPHELVWKLVDSSHGIARNLLGILAGRIRNDNLLRVTTQEYRLEFEVAANLDSLTGLHNRNWMDDTFPRMILRCQRDKKPLCLLMAGIDRIQGSNATHGRPAADGALKAMARLMVERLRPKDSLVYLGDDKFAILLPETPPDVALKIGERLRETASETTLQNADDVRLTLSIGISVMQPDDVLYSIYATADKALSQAKADGRNRVKLAATGSMLLG